MRLAKWPKFLMLITPFVLWDSHALAGTLTIQPFHLKLAHQLTRAQAQAELSKPRDLLAGEKAPANLPKRAPSSCAELIKRWDEWSPKAAGTDKWMQIAYNVAMVDCLTLQHLANAEPPSRSAEQAFAAMATGHQLSGDFYPGFPHAASDYAVLVKPKAKDAPPSLSISLEAGDAGRTYRTYYVLSGAAGDYGDEWFAVEMVESGTGTFADCGFVVIARGFDTEFSIRDRRYLGRCE